MKPQMNADERESDNQDQAQPPMCALDYRGLRDILRDIGRFEVTVKVVWKDYHRRSLTTQGAGDRPEDAYRKAAVDMGEWLNAEAKRRRKQ